ncbi:hypothetical protein PTE30175_01704 [Pandoraea terrae]|uniref:Uncharacterized protein n=1 Tax=Pandoraea terrae TaxID=1537710 RepID=A0A5E4U2R6_9BURK|nr:hypothetical protein PTE30175_01704 [Pandoraea terrae]
MAPRVTQARLPLLYGEAPKSTHVIAMPFSEC